MTQWGLDNLFNPGKRHMDDEKRRLQSTREEIGDNSGGRRIDLEGGTVSISVRRAPGTTPADDRDDDVTDPALEAEDLPAVALATDDAEIVPDVVEESPVVVDESVVIEAVVVEEPVVDEVVEADEPDDVPIEAPAPTPVVAAPRRSAMSANAWARRG